MEVSTGYPTVYERLQERMARLAEVAESPMAGFQQLHEAATADGALSRKTKELSPWRSGSACAATGASPTTSMIRLKRERAGRKWRTRSASIMMGGGPSVVYGAEAMAALDQLRKGAEPPGRSSAKRIAEGRIAVASRATRSSGSG